MDKIKRQNKDIEKVNNAVCKFFDVEIDSLYNRDRTAKATMARGFALYILHKDKGLSINRLAREYKRIPRAIFWHNSKICDFISCYPKYKNIYETICESIK